jgi:heme-degrading monooxygenase HmoA
MTFKEEYSQAFEALFYSVKDNILAMPGCTSLVLKRDVARPSVYYTLSNWESEQHLNAYRHSPLFIKTWSETKALFAEAPQAYSLIDVACAENIVNP